MEISVVLQLGQCANHWIFSTVARANMLLGNKGTGLFSTDIQQLSG